MVPAIILSGTKLPNRREVRKKVLSQEKKKDYNYAGSFFFLCI